MPDAHDRFARNAQAATGRQILSRHLERFVAFAFAHAEMLLEIGPSGRIEWAAGAFASVMGAAPESFLGQPLATVIAVIDHPVLEIAIASAFLRGRMPPMVLRLQNAKRGQVVMAAFLHPGSPRHLCVTLGPLAVAASLSAPGLQDAPGFMREAERQLGRTDGSLTLFNLQDWTSRAELNAQDRTRLLVGICDILLQAGGPGAVAGALGEGRYGLLSPSALDPANIAPALQSLLWDHPATRSVQVETASMQLTDEALTGPLAVRALRLVLSKFASSGSGIEDLQGGGLAGFIASAEARADAVRTVISERRFQLAYQPVVLLSDRRIITHYEALLRPVQSKGQSTRTTQDFVHLAELAGLVEDLDLAVLEITLAALQDHPSVSIAINVSGQSMQSPTFCERALSVLAAMPDSSSGRLLMELTETTQIEDFGIATATIRKLRALGVPICIDDFGSGAAAFRYLRDLPIDLVKIDGSYVQSAARGSRERGFVSSMVELAHSVDALTVAEMIETEEQAELMRSLGVEYGQGWLFGAAGPLPSVPSGKRRGHA